MTLKVRVWILIQYMNQAKTKLKETLLKPEKRPAEVTEEARRFKEFRKAEN
jgi:hypothetical protein